MEMPPVSNVTPLPTKQAGALFLAVGSPSHCIVDQMRRLHAALRDAEQRAHAELLHLLFIEHIDLDAQRFQLARGMRQRFRIKDIGGFGDKIAGRENAVGDFIERRIGRPCRRHITASQWSALRSAGFCSGFSLVWYLSKR